MPLATEMGRIQGRMTNLEDRIKARDE
jgi:hypothetical protein